MAFTRGVGKAFLRPRWPAESDKEAVPLFANFVMDAAAADDGAGCEDATEEGDLFAAVGTWRGRCDAEAE